MAVACGGCAILSLLFPTLSFCRDHPWPGPRAAQAEEPQGPASKDATKPTAPSGFTVDRYLVEGNTLLSDATSEAVLAKYKGMGKQFKDLEQARMDLEKSYHEAGYPTVL